MKIVERITEGTLDYFKKKYNFSNIIKYREGKTFPYYFIPPELVLHEKKSSYIEVRKELNKENPDCNWISSRQANRWFWETCELSSQEIFDLLVLHINDTDYRPECKVCGKELEFSGSVLGGYGNNRRPYNPNRIRYCSQKCSLLETSYLNYERGIEAQRTEFLNKGNLEDECYFYIARDYNNRGIKFGVTINTNHRALLNSYDNRFDVSDIRGILKGPRNYIADFEANIKYKLERSYESVSWNEIFDFLKYFLEVLNEMKIYYPTIKPL